MDIREFLRNAHKVSMKKKIILIAIVVAVIVALCFSAHYMPVWASIVTIAVLILGGVIGWFAKVFYDKYIKE